MDSFDSFTLAPLSAGDIIDRAVRLYRRHFVTLLRIVLAPSLIAYAGGIAWSVGWRNISLSQGDVRLVLNFMLMAGGLGVYLLGQVSFFALLGGTSRALVNYFLDGSPLRARDAYRAVRERFWSLVGATVIVIVLLVFVLSLVNTVVLMGIAIYIPGSTWLLRGAPGWVQTSFHLTFAALLGGLLLVLFLLVYGRIAYLPQTLMVEGRGVFSALGRSFTLAGRGLRRIGAILLFDLYVTWSVLLLLIIPLGWYAYLNGVDVSPLSLDKPLWYTIAYQTVGQLSEVLLAPIAILGFTLLYVDSRVRKEGFDIELLANRCLPAVNYVPPPPPARPASPPKRPFPSILGLDDYRPAPPHHTNHTEEMGQVIPVTISLGQKDNGTRICQHCAMVADPEDRFCRQCGAAYQPELGVRG